MNISSLVDQKKKSKNNEMRRKIKIKFDITMLNSIIGYLFKKSAQINRKALNNVYQLFSIIDTKIYEGNPMLEARIYFIKRALDAKIVQGLENDDIIINYCRTDTDNKEIEKIISSIPIYTRLNYNEIKFITSAIQDRLKYAYLLDVKDEIYSTVEVLDSGEYNSYKEVNEKLVGVCSKVITKSREINVMDDVDSISLGDNDYEDKLTQIFDKIKDPSRILRTGIRALNQILAPGYIGGRTYIYMGLPAGFKSGILLKSARDIKKYNKGIQPKKAGLRPTVLLVTMENTIEESIERLFNMTVTGDDVRNFTTKEAIKMLKEKGEMTVKDDEDIDIVIKYHANRTIDTNDLYTIIKDLEDQGKETIALVLDYIKRIRPYEYARDEKEELKNITNELKTLAKDFDIPVITAHQLNRSGAAAIDAAMTSNKEDLARFVGRSNVGSAWEVQENADWCCIVNVEKKRGTDNYYLTFKRIKIRYRDPHDMSYFNHPFEVGNRIKLIDDLFMANGISEASLASDFDGVIDINAIKGSRNATKRDIIDDDSDDIFDFSKVV